MKKFLLIISLFVAVNSYGAARFWVGGGSSANWAATSPTNWSTTSGGSNNASVPTSTDDVTFDGAGTGNTNSTVSATITVLSLTITSGYTATMTFNAVLTIASTGSLTLGANVTIGGSGSITIGGTCTLTSNGKTWPLPMLIQGTGLTKTFADNWTISGLLTLNANGSQTYSGSTLNLLGGLTLTNSAEVATGTTNLVLKGGSLGGNGTIQLNFTFDGNSTVSGTGVKFSTGTVTYTSGTITTTGSTISISGNTTFNTNGMSWANITFTTTGTTLTLNSLLTATGTITINNIAAITFAGTAGFTCANLTALDNTTGTITLANTVTYTVTNALNMSASRTGAILTITSDHATNKAILTFRNDQGLVTTCNVLAAFTRIDASAGRTIWTWNGTVTACFNVLQFTDQKNIYGADNL